MFLRLLLFTWPENEFPDPWNDKEKNVVDISGNDEHQRRILEMVASFFLANWKNRNYFW